MSKWYGALIFFLALQLAASAVRFYVRLVTIKRCGADDVAAFITLIFATTFCACLLAIFDIAQHRPAYDIPEADLFVAVELTLAIICLYIIGSICLKISLGLLLLRILIQKWHRMVIYTVGCVICGFGIAYFFASLFECGNPAHFYTRILEGQCFARDTLYGLSYTHAVLQAVADIIFALLPLSYLRTANLDWRTKISVGGILCVGSAGCICTLIRIGWIHSLAGVTTTFFETEGGIGVMSAAEMSIGIACLSLTTYKPLFRHYFPSNCRSGSLRPERFITPPRQGEKDGRTENKIALVSLESRNLERHAKELSWKGVTDSGTESLSALKEMARS